MARKATRKTTRRSKKKSNVLSLDFTGVETRKRVPEGTYVVKVIEVEQKTAESSGQQMLVWKFEVTEGKYKGAVLYYNTSLQDQSLWVLRGVLDALGLDTPDSAYDLDLEEVLGMECGVTVHMSEYQGKLSPKISELFSTDDIDDTQEDDEDEEEDDEDEEDEEDEEEGDEDEEEDDEEEEGEEDLTPEDIFGMKLPELRAVIKDYELKVDLSKKKTIKQKRDAVLAALTKEGYID